MQQLDRFGIRDARKGRLHPLERRDVALEHLELAAAGDEHARDERCDQLLGEIHVAGEVHECDLRLEHPELHQVPPGLRLLGAERRPEAIHLAEREGAGLEVELAALREIRVLVEVRRLEQRRGALARRRRQDRRIEQHEAALIEELAAGAHHLAADAQDGVLAGGAQPEMAMIEQERDAVLLRRDRVLRRLVQHLELGDAELVAERGAIVLAHGAGDDQRRFLRQVVGARELLRRHVFLEHHALHRRRAVAQ